METRQDLLSVDRTTGNKMVSAGINLNLLLAAAAVIFAAAVSSSSAAASDECVYTVYVRTGSIWKAGTDSIISLALADYTGAGVNITNLEEWGGLMGPGYDYFERGNLDIFSGRGPCLAAPPCWMELYSDGSGPHHGWYCNYVEVTTTGPHVPCGQQQFTVEQWLGTDVSPYELIATRDYCVQETLQKMEKTSTTLVN